MAAAGTAAQSKAASSVREKFSMEFVSADKEVAAFRNLLQNANVLPDLNIFDPDMLQAAPVQAQVQPASFEVDPVEELRMLFESAE